MVRVQVQFSEAQVAQLRERARRRRTSIAAVVRDAVEATLSTSVEPPSRDQLVARSLAAVGRFRSGESNRASEDHDRYLEDVYRS